MVFSNLIFLYLFLPVCLIFYFLCQNIRAKNAVLIVFSLIVLFHEFGHFLLAKRGGICVVEFSLGMGPRLFSFVKGGTRYSLKLLPFGGSCMMLGEDEGYDAPGETEKGSSCDQNQSLTDGKTDRLLLPPGATGTYFNAVSAWTRFKVVVAGPVFNFILAWFCAFFVISCVGFDPASVVSVEDGYPAQEAGLQVGDTIWSIDGHRIYFTTNVSEYLARGGDTHDIVVKRDGEKVALNDFYLVAREYPGQDGKMYGFYFGTKPATFGAKLQTTWYSAMDFVRMAWMGLSDLFAGAVGVKDLSGPVGIVSMMNEVGKESATKAAAFSNIAYFSAFIAVNLAVMNMLPLPALDGGRVFCLLVTWVLERISRRKIDPKYEGYIHTAGLVLLLALMAYVMYNDISKLVT